MLALVKKALGPGQLELMDVPEPEPGPGQIKIRVEATGICGTDLHVRSGHAFSFWPPVTLGHEFSGAVAGVGPGVTGWQIGDRLTSEPPVRTCGKCEYCQRGLPALCAERRSLGTGLDGAFAPYLVTPANRLHRLPDEVDLLSAALSEPVACCVHAVIEQGGVAAGDVVLITGPGPIGLLAAQVAAANGGRVLLVGAAEDEGRLALARQIGVAVVLMAGRDDVAEAVRKNTDGKGVDVALECAGVGAAARTCLEALKKRGRYVQVGLLPKPIEADFNLFVTRELSLVGSFGSTHTAWERGLRLMAVGLVQTRPLINAVLPLSRWEEGFALMDSKQACKVVLLPQPNGAGSGGDQ